jgi:hypothetical protein
LHQGPHKVPAAKSVEQLVNEVYEQAPKGPEGTFKAHDTTKDIPWSIIETGGTYEMLLPSNLETLADNAFAQVAIVAAKRLDCIYRLCGERFSIDHPTDKKVLNYLQGVSWALSGKRGNLAICPQTTGAMGHGFFHVAHTALDAKLGAGTWWARGSPHSLVKGVTGKAWDTDLDPSIRKIFSVITRAARTLDVTTSWASYFRTKDSFLGREIKKSLPHKKLGLITREESEYLDSYYEKEIKGYNHILEVLRDPQVEHLSTLADRIKEVGKNLTPLCTLVDNISTRRASLIYSKNKGQRKKQLKTPLQELIAGMEIDAKIKAFDPIQLHGLQSIHVPDDLDLEKPDGLATLSAQYMARLRGIVASGMPDRLGSICQQWAASVLGAPRRNSQ